MPELSFDSSYDYTPALAARFARRELRTRYGRLLIALVLGCLWALYCLREPALHWLSGFLAGLVFAFALTLVRWYRTTVATASAYSDQPIAVHFDSQGIRLSSSVLTSECPWRTVAVAHRIPEGLLLVQHGGHHAVPLPHQALSAEAMTFVLISVAAAGGRVQNGA